MSEHPYQLPKYKREKLYSPYRCPFCYKILRIKIFKNNTIKYNCQCKREWFISFNIDTQLGKRNPRKFDSSFHLRCSKCNSVNSPSNKYMEKCLKCNKIFCSKKCKNSHEHDNFKNLFFFDVICDIHCQDFIAYSKSCDKDLCDKCILNKKNHDIIYYKDILPKKEDFINNYNKFNSLADKFVTLFPDVRRKTNYRLIYYFHLREIIRNIYFNFSRLSIYNKYNFALISNLLENSDYITYNNDTSPDLILNYDTAPTCFLNSSKYIFNFLDNKISNIKSEFFKEKIIEVYSSFPNKKYLMIRTYKFSPKLYDSKTFELIYQNNNNLMFNLGNRYNFEDNKAIFNSFNNDSVLLIKINPKTNEVTENIIEYSSPYDRTFLMNEYFLCQYNNKISINSNDQKIDEIIFDHNNIIYDSFCVDHFFFILLKKLLIYAI